MRERRPALLLTLPDAVGLLALIQGLGLLYVGQLAGGFFCLLLSAVFLVPHLFLIWNRRLARPGSYTAWRMPRHGCSRRTRYGPTRVR